MLSKSLSIVFLIFLVGCSTTPIKHKQPIKSTDYKNYVNLTDQKEHQNKTFGQKVKEVFVKPKPTEPKKEPTVAAKKPLMPFNKKKGHTIPLRRVRPLNTNTLDVTENLPIVIASTDTDTDTSLVKKVVTYFICFQSFIIVLLGFLILKKRKKKKKIPTEKRELNL